MSKAAGEFFKELRKEHGFVSRDIFVAKCSLDLYRIVNLERGAVQPKISDFQAYAKVTGCDPARVMEVPVG